jgi:hypothetical protein
MKAMFYLFRTIPLPLLALLFSMAWPGSTLAGPLDEFLNAHPGIASRIVWTDGKGRDLPFARWTSTEKADLARIYQLLEDNAPDLGLGCKQAARFHDDQAAVFYKKQTAWRIYLAHVAHAIRLSARELVPWSLTSLNEQELDILFSGRSYFSWIAKRDQQVPKGIQPGVDFASRPEENFSMAAICDPRDGYRFLTGEAATQSSSLLGSTQQETVMKLSLFLRDNAQHGDPDSLNDGNFLLRDRLRAGKDFKGLIAYSGCHSAAKLLFDLARSVNIPLLLVAVHDQPSAFNPHEGSFLGHRGLVMNWSRPNPLVLWHADELYANGYMPVFLPESTRSEAFLRGSWLTPAELGKAGFSYRLEQQKNPFRSENVMRFPTLGVNLGRWKSDQAVRDFGTKLQETLCAASLLERVCKKEQSSSAGADSCIEKAGGCEAVLRNIEQYNGEFASQPKRVWR